MSLTVRSMSITAFAGRPGMLVEPTWLIDTAVSPMADSMRAFARAKCSGHFGSGSTMAIGCLCLRNAILSMREGSKSYSFSSSSIVGVMMRYEKGEWPYILLTPFCSVCRERQREAWHELAQVINGVGG